MNCLALLPLLAAFAAAQFPYYALPYAGYTPYYHASQYHAQDEFGQFSFGHSEPNQARAELKTLDGTVRGAYTYVDANNKINRVEYIADDAGFRVLGANNLPEAPVFDLEPPVFDLKAPVFDLKAPVFDLEAPVHDAPIPQPVEDTAEVKAAKAEFQVLYDEAAAAAAAAPDDVPAERKKRQIVYSAFHPLPVAKATYKYKTHSFDTVDADTPADTKLAELTEKEHEVTVPVAYPHYYHPLPVEPKEVKPVEVKTIAYPHFFSYAIHPSIFKVKEAERKKRETAAVAAIHPFALAKGTFKTTTFENVEGAEAPADTARADFQTQEHEYTYPVVTPYIYRLPVVAPEAKTVEVEHALPFSHYLHPFVYPFTVKAE